MKFIFLFLLAGALCFISCDSKRLYERNVDITTHSWHKDSVLTFNYQIDSTLDSVFIPKTILFAFNLRNTVDYAYRNLWLFVELKFPNKTVIKDTINIFLSDEQGYWLDNIKGGNIKESRHYYKFALSNPPKGFYTIKIQHAMREEYLNEIVSVGARIEKIK
jgi:gliding motility-associated lipoprotein GldH